MCNWIISQEPLQIFFSVVHEGISCANAQILCTHTQLRCIIFHLRDLDSISHLLAYLWPSPKLYHHIVLMKYNCLRLAGCNNVEVKRTKAYTTTKLCKLQGLHAALLQQRNIRYIIYESCCCTETT